MFHLHEGRNDASKVHAALGAFNRYQTIFHFLLNLIFMECLYQQIKINRYYVVSVVPSSFSRAATQIEKRAKKMR